MKPFRSLQITVVAAALLMTTFALAQAPGAGRGINAPAQTTSAQSLTLRAQRLTLLNSVPEASRADASALLDRADDLYSRSSDLQQSTLEAYVTALEQGDDPMVARASVAVTEAQARLTLAQDAAQLRVDANTFLSAHPELGGTFGAGLGGQMGMVCDGSGYPGQAGNGYPGPMANRSAGAGTGFGQQQNLGQSQNLSPNMGRNMSAGQRGYPGNGQGIGAWSDQRPCYRR